VGYLSVFFPGLQTPLAAFVVAETLLWTLTLVNILGVRAGGAVQVATTALKVLALLMVSAALFTVGSTDNLVPFAPKGLGALFPAISLVTWVLLGAESVTVPAEEVRDASRTIGRSAYIGFALATAVYFLVALSVCMALPSQEIAGTASPLALAARRALGPWGEGFITVGALVSITGVLNGWLLVTGRLPFAAARQGLAPAMLGRLHPRTGTPVLGLVLSSLLTGGLLALYFNQTLLGAYNFVALASSATALLAIAAACAAQIALVRREPERFTAAQRRRGPLMGLVGLLVIAVMIAGSGLDVGLLTLVVVVLPVPYYLWLRRRTAVSA
ncbi:MAG TPA: APC family permease, partial [Candidatus Polarisedimenticolia bacterium]|nr:APC family permease [Candidatus Polarisedimenticolia bacterium]